MLNLYRKLEGDASLHDIIDRLYCKILSDNRVNFFFGNTEADFDSVDIEKQIEKQRAFMRMMLGEENLYAGKSLEEAHKHLVEKGLNDNHFDIVIQYMKESLRETNVQEPTITEVLAELENHRDRVLCRSTNTSKSS